MFRIYTIISLLFVHALAMGQGVGDFSLLSRDLRSYPEKTYHDFINAAREDGDSTKVTVAAGLYGKFLTHQQRYAEAEKQLMHSLDNIQKMRSALRQTIPMASVSIYDTYDYLGEYY